jgi:stress-induced-phosphoprotein 1
MKEYINPELAEEANNRARDFFKDGKFPDALREYEDAIKRNPDDAKYWNNKATCLLKLVDFSGALKAADKALEVDDSYIKAYAKKGNAHFGLREYNKALEAFQRGLTADPNNAEFQEGVRKTHMKLYGGNETKQEAEERARHGMADPEVQRILADPQI